VSALVRARTAGRPRSGADSSRRAQARYETSVWMRRVKTGKAFSPSELGALDLAVQ